MIAPRPTVVVCLLALLVSVTPATADRVTEWLQALYTFESTSGDRVRDRAGVGQPLDLKIEKPKAVRRAKGTLDALHKRRQCKSALVLLRGLREFQVKAGMPVPGLLHDPGMQEVDEVDPIGSKGKPIDLDDDGPLQSQAGPSRQVIDLETYIIDEFDLDESGLLKDRKQEPTQAATPEYVGV